MKAGQAIFADTCAACHQKNGEGIPDMFPALRNHVATAEPEKIVRLILNGAPKASIENRPAPISMPAFGWKLTDEQITAVINFVRNSWGNSASVVTADQVRSARENKTSGTQ